MSSFDYIFELTLLDNLLCYSDGIVLSSAMQEKDVCERC